MSSRVCSTVQHHAFSTPQIVLFIDSKISLFTSNENKNFSDRTTKSPFNQNHAFLGISNELDSKFVLFSTKCIRKTADQTYSFLLKDEMIKIKLTFCEMPAADDDDFGMLRLDVLVGGQALNACKRAPPSAIWYTSPVLPREGSRPVQPRGPTRARP